MEEADLIVSLLTAGPGNLAVFDADLHFVKLSAAFAALTGLSEGTVAGRPLAEMLPCLAHVLIPILLHTLRLGVPILNQEIASEVFWSPGQENRFLVSCHPVRGAAHPDGGDAPVQGVILMLESVTEESPGLLQQRQRALLAGIIHAQEAERRAIAYELHDGLTQYVMASHAHLEIFQQALMQGDTRRADDEFQKGFDRLQMAVVESRRLVNGLRTLVLDNLGLAGALAQLLVEEKNRAGWETAELDHNLGSRRFDNVLETTVYRVAQEALTNARKHAQTSEVSITLIATVRDDTDQPILVLEVRDQGLGFDVAAQMSRYGHLGLHSMSERVQLLGGTYELHSTPGAGTVVRATFPILKLENERA